jgi:hypothetical protein
MTALVSGDVARVTLRAAGNSKNVRPFELSKTGFAVSATRDASCWIVWHSLEIFTSSWGILETDAAQALLRPRGYHGFDVEWSNICAQTRIRKAPEIIGGDAI